MTSIAAGEAGTDTAVDPARGDAVRQDETATARPRAVHRLRDLDRRERVVAAAVGLAVLLAPLAAFVLFVPEWVPANDPALMGLRSLDVGTARTPLLGQPSQSGIYGVRVASAHHPGPLHFYLMAGPIRLLGGPVGMPLVSVLITGACLGTSAWAAFRQLGRLGGLAAALILSAVAFTTGASSLINPVSSNIAGYPLLACAVLAWCVSAGDVRLLPLTAAVASFTAQQHLSVVPATVVLVVGGVGLLALRWHRERLGSDPAIRRELRRAVVWSGIVTLVLWAPVLLQQVFGQAGNLSEMLWFARHGNRETLGFGSAVGQVAHAVGLPPMLGRTDLSGTWLIAEPAAMTWVSAAAVLAAVAVAGRRWHRQGDVRASLAPMVGVVTVAGLVNGSSVPVGLEQTRLAFYHWAFALAFLVTLTLAMALAGPVRRLTATRFRPARPALVALAVAVIAVPSLVNPTLDRRSNTPRAAYSGIDRTTISDLADAMQDRGLPEGDDTLLVSRHEPAYAGLAPALAFELADRGHSLKHPLTDRFFVHDQRLVDRGRLDDGLVLVVDGILPGDTPPGGELVAEVALAHTDAVEAYRRLVAALEGAPEVSLGPEVERALDDVADDDVRLMLTMMLVQLTEDPADAMLQVGLLEFLRDHPLEGPALPAEDIDGVIAMLDELDRNDHAGRMTGLRLYHLDRDEMIDFTFTHEIGRPAS